MTTGFLPRKSLRLTISPACEGRVKSGATDPTFTLSFIRRKPIGSSPECHVIVLSKLILRCICIKRCKSVEGIAGLWTGIVFFSSSRHNVWLCFGHGYPQVMQFVVYKCLFCQPNLDARWPHSQNARHLFSHATEHAGPGRGGEGRNPIVVYCCGASSRPTGEDRE